MNIEPFWRDPPADIDIAKAIAALERLAQQPLPSKFTPLGRNYVKRKALGRDRPLVDSGRLFRSCPMHDDDCDCCCHESEYFEVTFEDGGEGDEGCYGAIDLGCGRVHYVVTAGDEVIDQGFVTLGPGGKVTGGHGGAYLDAVIQGIRFEESLPRMDLGPLLGAWQDPTPAVESDEDTVLESAEQACEDTTLE